MRILVVEDEASIANFVAEGLREENFAVDIAHDGIAGRTMALSNDYDVILLDWLLPGLSGIEVCRAVREESPAVPVIFLTAKDTVEDVVFALDGGANDYIRKPFRFDELLARIRVQLRARPDEETILRAGDVELNPATHAVKRAGRDVSLTPKEFALLEFLLRNKGKVCTRTRIIEHVWDIHFDADTSVIDVYMNYLRKKLGLKGDATIIQTVRGVGYVVRDEP